MDIVARDPAVTREELARRAADRYVGTMNDQPHDEPVLPDEVTEDLSPRAEADEVSGGATDYYLNLDGIKGESVDDSHKG